MDYFKELAEKYPFAFRETEEGEMFPLAANEVEEHPDFFLFTPLNEQIDIIAEIATEIQNYINSQSYNSSAEYFIEEWNNLYDKYYEQKKLEEEKKAFEKFKSEIQTELNNLQTKNQRINYLRRRITDIEHEEEGAAFSNPKYIYLEKELKFWENYIEEEEEETPPGTEFKQKLTWNGNQNVLYDLFRQLKNIAGKDKTNPLITNSAEEIAIFLKQSFTNCENLKVSTITAQLKNNQYNPNNRPKQGRRIEIDCK